MVDGMVRRMLSVLVRLYQIAVSPLLPMSCRFVPSCSEYALLALKAFPTHRALWLIARRLLRCNPLCRSGYDPLPAPGHRHR
ncbi:MAG: membrane protein insertion efficiency factor YidD [Candidatus Sumerlaeia bacterium]